MFWASVLLPVSPLGLTCIQILVFAPVLAPLLLLAFLPLLASLLLLAYIIAIVSAVAVALLCCSQCCGSGSVFYGLPGSKSVIIFTVPDPSVIKKK
jgi:hypothetical protein